MPPEFDDLTGMFDACLEMPLRDSLPLWGQLAGSDFEPPEGPMREVYRAVAKNVRALGLGGNNAAAGQAACRLIAEKLNGVWVELGDIGTPMTRPMTHDDSVLRAAFSADGLRIVTTSFDGTARVWDASTGEAITPPLRHVGTIGEALRARFGDQIEALMGSCGVVWDGSFSPDGLLLVTACYGGRGRPEGTYAMIWDACSGRPITGPMRHTRQVHHVAFSVDGSRILASSSPTIVWDAQTCREIARFPGGHHSEFDRHGSRVVAASWSEARVWDGRTGSALTPPMRTSKRGFFHLPPTLDYAAFSPDARLVVAGGTGAIARVWDSHSGQPVTPDMGHRYALLKCSFSPDSLRVLTVSSDLKKHGQARVWDARTGQPLSPIMEEEGAVFDASFSPDGQLVMIPRASRDIEKTHVRLWDWRTGQPITPPIAQGGGALYAAFSPDGHGALIANRRGAQVFKVAMMSILDTPPSKAGQGNIDALTRAVPTALNPEQAAAMAILRAIIAYHHQVRPPKRGTESTLWTDLPLWTAQPRQVESEGDPLGEAIRYLASSDEIQGIMEEGQKLTDERAREREKLFAEAGAMDLLPPPDIEVGHACECGATIHIYMRDLSLKGGLEVVCQTCGAVLLVPPTVLDHSEYWPGGGGASLVENWQDQLRIVKHGNRYRDP